MSMRHVTCTLVIILSTVGALSISLCQGTTRGITHQDEVQERFRAEAIKGWEKLDFRDESFRCEGLYDAKYIDNSVEKCKVIFIRKRSFASLEKHFIDPKTDKVYAVWVLCRGPRYSFFLKKTAMDRPFVVEAFLTRGEPEPTSTFIHLDNFIFRLLDKPFSAPFGKLPELIRDKQFAITRTIQTQIDTLTLVSIDYQYADAYDSAHDGTLGFDPSHDWAIVSFRDQATIAQGPFRGITNYEGGNQYTLIDGRSVLHSFNEHSKRGDTLLESHRWLLHSASYNRLDDESFTLKAYGLQEIATDVPTQQSFFSLGNWLFWACLAGAILAFVGLRVGVARMKGDTYNQM